MRRVVLLALLAALVGTLAVGCGGSLDPVAKAATKTADAGSFRFSFSFSLGLGAAQQAGGQAVGMTGDGAYDASSRRLRASVAMGGTSMEAILDAGGSAPAVYVRPPAGTNALPGGKTWLKLDLSAAAKQAGVDLGTLTTEQLDPRRAVDALKQAGDSTKVGEEQVDGVQTTHYRVVIDAKKALEQGSAKEKAQGEKALGLVGSSSFPVDVWVDGDGYLRRVATDFGGGANAFLSLKAQLDLSGYGSDVTVDLPPAGEVAEGATSFLPLRPKPGG